MHRNKNIFENIRTTVIKTGKVKENCKILFAIFVLLFFKFVFIVYLHVFVARELFLYKFFISLKDIKTL